MKRYIDRLPLLLLLLCAVAFSLKGLREPDLWWQIRTGQWIIAHGAVPRVDVFSYTFAGSEWINIKWGYEVIAALIADCAGAECIFLLQAVVSIVLIWLLYRCGILCSQTLTTSTPKGNHNQDYRIAVVTALSVLVPVLQYRMNGRPEMSSHLLTAAYLYILSRYVATDHRRLWWIPILQLLWVNLHEAYGLGIVILSIYSLCSWVMYGWRRETIRPIRLTQVWAVSIFSLVINPNGIRLLTRPFEIFRQVQENKYTIELMSIVQPQYWSVEAYWAMAILCMVLIWVGYRVWRTKRAGKSILSFMETLGTGYVVTLVAMCYLAMTAQRNIIFLAIYIAPLWCGVVVQVYSWLSGKYVSWHRIARYGVMVSLAILYLSIVSGQYYRHTHSRDVFGLGVVSNSNPTGAADYIASHHLTGTCFSDYLSSSYLLWRLQPDFKTYIDLRDLDVFPASFIDSTLLMSSSPPDFRRYDKRYGFRYVVLLTHEYSSLHAYLYNDSIYACTYVDDVAAVYEKTDQFTREDIFAHHPTVDVSSLAMAVNLIFNPLYSPTSLNNDDVAAAEYYKTVGRMSIAIQRAQQAIKLPEYEAEADRMLGDIDYDMAMVETVPTKRSELLTTAQNYYQQSQRADGKGASALLGLCAVSSARGDVQAAMQYATQAVATQPDLFTAHLYLAKCIAQAHPADKPAILKAYKTALCLQPRNPAILYDIGATALSMGDCHQALEYWHQIVDRNMLSMEQKHQLSQAEKSCR